MILYNKYKAFMRKCGKLGLVLADTIDQIIHGIWGFSLVTVAVQFGMNSMIGAVILPLIIAVPRELVDQWPVEDVTDTALDTLSFVIGGTVAGLAFLYSGGNL